MPVFSRPPLAAKTAPGAPRPRIGKLPRPRPAKRLPAPSARAAAGASDGPPTPHLGARDLMDLGGQVRQTERELADIDYEYGNAQLAANRAASQALEDNRHNAESIEDRMAGRGILRSSIRDTAQYRNEADTSERIADGQRALYLRSADDERRKAALRQRVEELTAGYAGIAAENARALPVPDTYDAAALAEAQRRRTALARQQSAGRRAPNTRGVRTVRRQP